MADNAPSNRFMKVMGAQYMRYMKLGANEAYGLFIATQDETDIRRWHVLVCNLPTYPWAGLECIFELIAPSDEPEFPQRPPRFVCKTPNGLFQCDGEPICISFGEFHSDAWKKKKSMGMMGFAEGGVAGSFVSYQDLDDSGGIRILQRTCSECRAEFSRGSAEYNRTNYPYLMESFEEMCVGPYSELLRGARILRLGRAGVPVEDAARADSAWLRRVNNDDTTLDPEELFARDGLDGMLAYYELEPLQPDAPKVADLCQRHR